MRRFPVALMAALASIGPGLAQESAHFKLTEHVLNLGGHPIQGTTPSSAGFICSFDALGDGLVVRGLSSPGFAMDAGFGQAYPPPGEVHNLRLVSPTTLDWDPENSAGSYNLYRGLISSLPGLSYGVCQQQDISQDTTTDPSVPMPGTGFFYLVTVANRLSEEGTKGFNSIGSERLGTVCP